jgi:ABC-type multidrug transport system fused ATPase/permease subunit
MFIILLILTPNIIILLIILIFDIGLHAFSVPETVAAGIQLWGITLLSPHGAMFNSLLDISISLSSYISDFPPWYASMIFMLAEGALFGWCTYKIDYLSIQVVPFVSIESDPTYNAANAEKGMDNDVLEERERTSLILSSKHSAQETVSTIGKPADVESGSAETDSLLPPLCINRLRKVFPPKRENGPSVVATEDISFVVEQGEIFGLLGANGAGKVYSTICIPDTASHTHILCLFCHL